MVDETDLSIHLLNQWKQCQQDTVTELFDRYELRLIGLVRSRIDRQLKSRIDSHAIVNSTFREFLNKVDRGEFVPQGSGSLWSYLAAIARNKANKQLERLLAKKRTPTKEVNITNDLLGSPEFIDREPDAKEELDLMDELEQFMEPMNSIQRRMLVQRLEGFSIEKIAMNVERAEAYVRDFLKKTRDKFEARLKGLL